MRESERLESAVQACAISLTNTRFPPHGNSPYPILAGTRGHVVKDYLTTEMQRTTPILEEREEMQRPSVQVT